MVAMSEKLCRNDTRPQCCRRRKDAFGRYGNSLTASASSANSVAGNYPNGGLAGNIPNGTTDYTWQGWQTIEERNPFGGSGSTDTPTKQFIWGTYIDECLQINLLSVAGLQSLPVGAYYLLQDLLYRTAALTNSSGDIVEAYDTDAYGNTLIFTAPDTSGNWWGDAAVQSSYGANDIIYCGYRFDPETQNYYVRNRTYNPALGRWITRDPIGYAGGINLYGYVDSAPVGLFDPNGMRAGRFHSWNGPLHDMGRKDGVCRYYQNTYYHQDLGIVYVVQTPKAWNTGIFSRLSNFIVKMLTHVAGGTDAGAVANDFLKGTTVPGKHRYAHKWDIQVWAEKTRVYRYRCGTHFADPAWESTTLKYRHIYPTEVGEGNNFVLLNSSDFETFYESNLKVLEKLAHGFGGEE